MKQARAAINVIHQSEIKYRARILLMEALAQSGDLDGAEDTLQLLCASIGEITNVWRQIQALCQFVTCLARLDAVDAAKSILQIAQQIAGSISDDWLRVGALRKVESPAAN